MISSENVAADCLTWRLDEQDRWKNLFDPACNKRPPWVRQTQYQNAGVYTRFLDCARRNDHRPELCSDAVRAFVLECERGGCGIVTISGYLWAIWKVLGQVSGDTRPEWLLETCLTFDQAAKETVPQGAGRKVDSAEIVLAGKRLILEARAMAGVAGRAVGEIPVDQDAPSEAVGRDVIPWEAVQSFRDGLFLLIGAFAPERLRALTDIRIPQIDMVTGVIAFIPRQIKMKRHSPRVLPAPVLALLQEWLDIWRPGHADEHDCLWIAKGGRAPTNAAMYAAMRTATGRPEILGQVLTPHQLRDAAATLIVEDCPAMASLASIVLDHRDRRMTRAYTLQANQIVASRALSQAISRRSEETLRKVRSATRSTIALNPTSRRLRGRPTI
jgi:hypothetical protein